MSEIHGEGTQTFVDYRNIKRETICLLDDCLKWLDDASTAVSVGDAPEVLRANRERLNLDRFQLLVVGEFSSGKSYFVNVLLKHLRAEPTKKGGFKVRGLLPDRISPSTSVVTVLRYGEKFRASLHYRSGERRDVSVDELASHLAEPAFAEQWIDALQGLGRTMERALGGKNEEPIRRNTVERVEIDCPSDWLKNGVEIVDTPGTGSVLKEHGIITRRFLPRADAILFLFPAQPPINKEARLFLSQCRFQTERFFFIQTMKDREFDTELRPKMQGEKSVLEVATQQNATILTSEIGERPTIHVLSSRWAACSHLGWVAPPLDESGFPSMETALESFLVQNRGQARLRQQLWQIEQAILPPLESLEVLRAQVGRSLEEIRQQFDEQQLIVEEIRMHAQRLRETIAVELSELLEEIEESPEKCTEALEKDILPKISALDHSQLRDAHFHIAHFLSNAINSWIYDWTKETVEKRLRKVRTLLRNDGQELARQVRRLADVTNPISEARNRVNDAMKFRFSLPETRDVEARLKPLVSSILKEHLGTPLQLCLKIPLIGQIVSLFVGERFDKVRQSIEDGLLEQLQAVADGLADSYRQVLVSEKNAIEAGVTTAAEAAIAIYEEPLRILQARFSAESEKVHAEEARVVVLAETGRELAKRCAALRETLGGSGE